MIFKKILFFASIWSLAIVILMQSSQAQNIDLSLNGIIWSELEGNWGFNSDGSDGDVNTAYLTIEPYIVLSLTEKLALETLVVFEQVQYTDPNENTIIDNHGLFVEQLLMSYTGDNYYIFGGKFAPSFGKAWDLAPGIFGYYFAEDYEIKEKIGGGASLSFEPEQLGAHTFTANSFFADTTGFSEATITKRGNLDINDGGISNTEDLSSFTVTLDSENLFGIEGLNTHLGYSNQSDGDADENLSNETGYVVGANFTFPIAEEVEGMTLLEWASFDNVYGYSTEDINYMTTSLALTIYEQWNIAASYTRRDYEIEGDEDLNDYLYQLSGGYEFENGIYIDLGYSRIKEDGIRTDYIGTLLGYVYEF